MPLISGLRQRQVDLHSKFQGSYVVRPCLKGWGGRVRKRGGRGKKRRGGEGRAGHADASLVSPWCELMNLNK